MSAPRRLAGIKSGKVHPMEAKKRLASMIVEEYHGADAAQKAQGYFESKFQRREVPTNVPVYRIAEDIWICELMKQLNFAPSTSEARRLVSQGAVRVDGETINGCELPLRAGRAQGARSRQAPRRPHRALVGVASLQSERGANSFLVRVTILPDARDLVAIRARPIPRLRYSATAFRYRCPALFLNRLQSAHRVPTHS